MLISGHDPRSLCWVAAGGRLAEAGRPRMGREKVNLAKDQPIALQKPQQAPPPPPLPPTTTTVAAPPQSLLGMAPCSRNCLCVCLQAAWMDPHAGCHHLFAHCVELRSTCRPPLLTAKHMQGKSAKLPCAGLWGAFHSPHVESR